MKPLFAVPALAVALALMSTAAMAATSGTAPAPQVIHPLKPTPTNAKPTAATSAEQTRYSRCTALESQFDSTIGSYQMSKQASAAKTLRQQGGDLCAAGKTHKGISKLEHALKDIGTKPTS